MVDLGQPFCYYKYSTNKYIIMLNSRNKICCCCGIKAVNNKYFMTKNGKLTRITLDHIVLASLGGPSTQENLSYMCYDCNFLRGNTFAEQQEFIDWYKNTINPNKSNLPAKNFSYLYEKKQKSFFNKKLSTNNKYKLVTYTHPVYGTSIIAEKIID